LVTVRGDGVLFAKNSDRDANEAQLLDWQPRRTYPPGARLRCTWIEVPQVRETYAVLLSRPYWMWGAEMGTNEYGVTIGNEAVFTRQPYAKTGLTGMDLLRLALERARTAGDAVRTMVELLAEFGQGGSCCLERRGFTYHNSFLVADPRSALVLETAGRHHAVEEVRGARSISNGLTISGFAEQHSDRIKTRISACRRRQGRTQELVERAEQPLDMMRILRDHGADCAEPHYSWINGGLGAACVHAGGLVAASQTTGSWVADLRAGAIRHWVTGTAAPCTSLFKPVSVEQPLDIGPDPTNRADELSLWWRHERLHRTFMQDPRRLGAIYCAQRDEIERSWLDDPPLPAAALAAASRLEMDWTRQVVAGAGADTRPGFVRRYWARRNTQAGLNLLSQSRTTKSARAAPVASR
jgi:dipeptidase